jgi:hypothetical protein
VPRPPSNAKRGSQVGLQKRKRAADWRALLQSKVAAPGLSLRLLARQEKLSHNSAAKRWKAYESARSSGASESAALDSASGDARGGHNRALSLGQESLLEEIVRAAVPSMTHTQIREEALHLHTAAHSGQHQLRSVPSPLGSFRASSSFVTRFKRAHSLASRRTTVCYAPRPKAGAPSAYEQGLGYTLEVHEAILEFGPALVLNMDETAISKIDPPTTAVVAKGSGQAARIATSIGALGQQITTMPCISAAGDKLQLCAVLKGKTPRCLLKITEGASPALRQVRLYYSEKGWVNAAIMVRWFAEVVQPYTRSAPAALILDSYSTHFTDEVRAAAAAMNLRLIQVPPGQTAVCQPLDVQYNSTLLNTRKRLWSERKRADPWTEDSPQAAIDRQAQAYLARTKPEGVAAFAKANLLP